MKQILRHHTLSDESAGRRVGQTSINLPVTTPRRTETRDGVCTSRGQPDLPNNKRWLYLCFGWIFFALGIVGVVLPVIPTSPFMVVALWAFSKSSKRFEEWLYNHRYFGPGLRSWRKHRVIPLYAKLITVGAMSLTLTVSIVSDRVPWWGIMTQVFLMAIAIFIVLHYPSKVPQESGSQD